MDKNEFQPHAPAPCSGLYEELNVFGAPTGVMTLRDKGEPLPSAPRGFAWRPLAELSSAELRTRAARYREMAASATTDPVRISLLKIAERLDAKAAEREASNPNPAKRCMTDTAV